MGIKELGEGEKMKRIIHIDIDAFFASVEQILNPDLLGKAVIVGGLSDRGVVATCSYEARAFGVHSAMPSYKAKQLCPEGIFIRGNHREYEKFSIKVFEIVRKYGSRMEQVSIDEAYIDVSDYKGSVVQLAKQLKEEIHEATGLNVSVGIAYNKFLAKLASDWKKPNGLFMITPDMMPDILLPLDIIRIHGLGKKTADKLYQMNIHTVNDLYKLSKNELIFILGKSYGEDIYDKIRGIDQREIEIDYERKSLGTEITLPQNITDRIDLQKYIDDFIENIYTEINRKHLLFKTVTLKYKYEDFKSYTKSKSLENPTSSKMILKELAYFLMDHTPLEKRVRLLGLSVSNISENTQEQLMLF